MKIVVKNARDFKNAVDAIVSLIDEGQIEIKKQGLFLREMDPSKIAMVSFEMSNNEFEEYDVEEERKIGIDFDSLSKILARARNNEKLEITVEDNMLNLSFISEEGIRTFSIALIEIGDKIQKEPKLEFKSKAILNANILKNIIKDASLISSHITFIIGENFKVLSVGDVSKLVLESTKTSTGIFDIELMNGETKEQKATFPLQYLSDILQACPNEEKVELLLKSENPIKISYRVSGANVSYLLAPRREIE